MMMLRLPILTRILFVHNPLTLNKHVDQPEHLMLSPSHFHLSRSFVWRVRNTKKLHAPQGSALSKAHDVMIMRTPLLSNGAHPLKLNIHIDQPQHLI